MAEFSRLPTQEELSRMLYQMQLGNRSQQDIINENLAKGSTVKPIPDNIFQKMAGGAQTAKEQVNKLGNMSDVAKLFPGYTGQSQVTIPKGYNFAAKQDPSGGVVPAGIQTQQINIDQLLKAIKPADVLGLTGAQQAYSDIGMGKAPKPMDVLDVAGLGATGLGAGKGLLKAGVEAGKYAAPAVGRMAEQYAVNTGLLSPLVAYHGTPHTFDQFDISKVGTGEGAQAYGHGIYFAEAPGVARGYQMALANKSGEITTIGGNPINDLYQKIENQANKLPPKEAQIEYEKAAMLEKMMLDTPPDELISYAKDIGSDPKVISWLEKEIAPKTKFPGSLFKVDIPDKAVETFMEWDKPLKDQPEVLRKIRSTIDDKDLLKSFDYNVDKGISGGNAYSSWVNGKLPKDKSETLNKAGIQGIKYLDQGSRMEGTGTKNFVVFDPNIVKMLERNNKSMVPVKETTADLVSKARLAYEQNPNDSNLWKEYLRLRSIRDAEK